MRTSDLTLRALRLALIPIAGLVLAGCPPPPPPGEVTLQAEVDQVTLRPGESRSVELTVRCSFVPCDAVPTASPQGPLPVGVRMEGLDAPLRQGRDASESVWALTLSSGPDVPDHDGDILLSVRPADGHGFSMPVPMPPRVDLRLRIADSPAPVPAPVASFGFTPENPEPGQPIAFDATASGGAIVGYSWDFGADGSIEATGANATFSFGVAGTWPVRLEVVDAAGQVGETTRNLVVVGGGGGDAVLTLSFAGAGSGVVTYEPTAVACSRDSEPVCSRRFPSGSIVVLTAFAYGGARLGGWEPGCSSIGPAGDVCTVVMDGPRQITLRID